MAQSSGTPPAEIAIDVALVRALLQSQHPDLASLALIPLASGWDNASFRLGDDLIVRLPRRKIAAELLVNEQRWLPELAKLVSLPIPAPIRSGVPGVDYPWHWSVVPWFDGDTADSAEPSLEESAVLAKFLSSLHVAAPANAPRNQVRGVPLASREAIMSERIERLRTKNTPVSARVLSIWNDALSAPIDVADTWIHGDLHPRNVLVDRGRLRAIIDWGDIACGDRATDLASIWMLFSSAQSRRRAIERYDATPDTWRRAKGWAILFGVTLLDVGLADDPRHGAVGQRTLMRVVEDS